VADLLAVSGMDLVVTVEGNNLAALSPIARVDLLALEPYRGAGDVSGAMNDLRIDELQTERADSMVGGWLAVHRTEDATPRIEGELVANQLDLDQILALADRAAGEEDGTEPAPSDARRRVKVGCFPPLRSRSKRWTGS
jgi:hypothetical protein